MLDGKFVNETVILKTFPFHLNRPSRALRNTNLLGKRASLKVAKVKDNCNWITGIFSRFHLNFSPLLWCSFDTLEENFLTRLRHVRALFILRSFVKDLCRRWRQKFREMFPCGWWMWSRVGDAFVRPPRFVGTQRLRVAPLHVVVRAKNFFIHRKVKSFSMEKIKILEALLFESSRKLLCNTSSSRCSLCAWTF